MFACVHRTVNIYKIYIYLTHLEQITPERAAVLLDVAEVRLVAREAEEPEAVDEVARLLVERPEDGRPAPAQRVRQRLPRAERLVGVLVERVRHGAVRAVDFFGRRGRREIAAGSSS